MMAPTSSTPRTDTALPRGGWPIVGLFLLAALYTAHFARDFLLPLVLALMLHPLLMPGVRAMKQVRIPQALGAGIMLALLLALAGTGIYRLAAPAREWLADAPSIARELEVRLRSVRRPVEQMVEAADQVRNLAVGGEGEDEPPEVVREPQAGAIIELFSSTTRLVTTGTSAIILLYFLLASGDLFLRRLVHVLPKGSDKAKALEIAACIEHDLSRYVVTITLINAFLGVAVGIAMALLGLPNPALWGVLAGVLNFVPYLGSLVGVVVMTLVSFGTTGDLSQALIPPLVFLALTLIESELVTPFVLGRRLLLNPVVIFVGLTLWTFLWGIPGAILAVPMLVVLRIASGHVERLRPLGVFLGSNGTEPGSDRAAPERARTL